MANHLKKECTYSTDPHRERLRPGWVDALKGDTEVERQVWLQVVVRLVATRRGDGVVVHGGQRSNGGKLVNPVPGGWKLASWIVLQA